MDGYKLQLRLFDFIRERMNGSSNWIDEISEKLSLSRSAVYKKVNATSAISLEELALLLLEYRISFDDLIRLEESSFKFKFPFFERGVRSFLDYILPLKEYITLFSQLPNVKVFYPTHELPVFYWFLQRDLCFFKLNVFAHTVWEIEGYKDRKMSLQEFSGENVIMKEVNQVAAYYMQIPCVEFWNQGILSNTLNQIKYFANSGYFESLEDALLICDRLKDIVQHVKNMAMHGKKYPIGQEPQEKHPDFLLFHNETAHTSNTICVVSDTIKAVFPTYDSPNFMVTQDNNLVEYTVHWMERLRRHSLPVSKDASKSRNYLFSRIFKMIDLTKGELESLKKTGEAFSI